MWLGQSFHNDVLDGNKTLDIELLYVEPVFFQRDMPQSILAQFPFAETHIVDIFGVDSEI